MTNKQEITEFAKLLYNFREAMDIETIEANIQSFLKANHYVILPEGEPQVLSDGEIWAVTNYEPNKEEPLTLQDGRKVAQAQRDSDIKFYSNPQELV